MSCSLYWKPSGSGNQVGDAALRNAVEKHFGRRAWLDYDSLEFLRGLAAAGIEGASELIEAIERHERIEVYQEC